MNIGFEAKRFFMNNTGLGNYSRFVVRALSTTFPDNRYYLYTPSNPVQHDAVDILNSGNVNVVTPGAAYRFFKATSVWRTVGIGSEPTVATLQVFHGLSQELPLNLPSKIKKVITVHDLIFYRYPEFYKSIDVAIYKKKLKSAVDRADNIIAISEQTSCDLQEFLKVDPSRITIIYQGSHPNFKRRLSRAEIDSVTARYNLPAEYILTVGTIEKRKNLMTVVKALSLIPKSSRIPLVVLGRPTTYFKEVVAVARERGVLSDMIVPGNVPFPDFPAIYQKASLFIYPSLFEGFGIPLVEAIESRVPVITSHGSCFSEAAGPSSIFVDPTDEEALADGINRVLLDSALAKSMVAASSEYIRKFEPAAIANKLMSVYQA
jgi:glycosyltransferase involved in cell wall biosynthesis